MADLLVLNPNRAHDWNGDFAPGALVRFYLSGTTTVAPVYQDAAGTVPFAQPIAADAEGILPPVFSSVSLRAVATDADGETLPGFPLDPVPRSITSLSGAALTPFSATAEIPVTNVQDAIERVQDNQAAALSEAGVAVTVAPVLTNINATTTPSGRYRYATGTTGTFPGGVVVADGGTVVISAGAAGNASMVLTTAAGREFQRTMTALSWGAWSESVLMPVATVANRYPVSTGSGVAWSGIPGPHIILEDRKTSGTNGGDFDTGADRIRVLNTEVYDIFDICTLASNQFTLAAGTYIIEFSAPANSVNLNQAFLYNVTASSAVFRGTSCFTGTQVIASEGRGVVTLSVASALEIRHRCGTTKSGDGFGVASSFGTEVYTRVCIWRIA